MKGVMGGNNRSSPSPLFTLYSRLPTKVVQAAQAVRLVPLKRCILRERGVRGGEVRARFGCVAQVQEAFADLLVDEAVFLPRAGQFRMQRPLLFQRL